MAKNSNLDHDSPAVQKHLDILQAIIQRMAENSRSCKLWCITLVSATLVLVARTGEANHAMIALAPAVFFGILDSYYLGLERGFRNFYKAFVEKLHRSELCVTDLYKVSDDSSKIEKLGRFLWALFRSPSTFPFYLVIVGTILLTRYYVI